MWAQGNSVGQHGKSVGNNWNVLEGGLKEGAHWNWRPHADALLEKQKWRFPVCMANRAHRRSHSIGGPRGWANRQDQKWGKSSAAGLVGGWQPRQNPSGGLAGVLWVRRNYDGDGSMLARGALGRLLETSGRNPTVAVKASGSMSPGADKGVSWLKQNLWCSRCVHLHWCWTAQIWLWKTNQRSENSIKCTAAVWFHVTTRMWIIYYNFCFLLK